MRRILSGIVAMVITVGFLSSPALAAESTGFSDVADDAWYAQAVALCAEKGVMVGTGEGQFSPDETLSCNQCLTLALRLYDLCHGGDGVFPPAPDSEAPSSDVWWRDGAWYLAQQEGLREESWLLGFLDEDQSASRWGFAETLYAVLEELPAVRTVDIPDMERDDVRSGAVYALYEAGILTGINAYGTFDGDGSFTRAQAAVMAARVLDESLRVSDPLAPLPSEGYTLTYLMDGVPDCGIRYPVCVLGVSEENEGHTGFLLLDGTLLP